jgi:hypothetical protein
VGLGVAGGVGVGVGGAVAVGVTLGEGVGVPELGPIWINFAIEGTPLAFRINSM